MTNPIIETDLAQILLEIKSDIKDFKKDVDGKLDKLSEDVSSLKVCQAEIKGDIKTLDEKISGQKDAIAVQESPRVKTAGESIQVDSAARHFL